MKTMAAEGELITTSYPPGVVAFRAITNSIGDLLGRAARMTGSSSRHRRPAAPAADHQKGEA